MTNLSDSTSRTDFVNTWLVEMPAGLGSFETFDQIVYNISDLRKSGVKIVDLGNGLKRVDLPQSLYYWYQSDDQVILGVELDKRPQGLVVRLTGKNPKYRGKPPYASDLYIAVLNDNKTKSLRLLSDQSLSDEGRAVWDKLFSTGHSVSVYDQQNPGQSFVTFSNQQQMDQYFKHDDTDFKRYQYVLSLNGENLAETRSFFSTRRFRELIPGLL
jgi:hypothetical protein